MKPLVGLLVWTIVSAAVAAPVEWPEVKLPPRSHAEWVTNDAVVNGLPTRLQHFASELTPREVLGFYEREWARRPVGTPRRVDTGGWLALSTLAGGLQVAVQVREHPEGRGSEGLISWGHVQGLQRDLAPPWLPRFADHRIAQSMASTDGPVRSEHVTLVSQAPFEVQVRRWRDHWQRQGWRTTFDRESPANAEAGRGWLASFERAPQSVDVVISWQPHAQRGVATVNLLTPATAALTR
ncbi:hypothetical protein KAK06_15235 [Ideonella sp. 4Y11]|uniref:DUF3047 domain-containing protein n=1 Tax=Ideonella aquatica TaxID=2824119 RepID=A0A940YNU8_9BURK|nr:hypothetical protein [Ideonella aquatica]MBQ0960307.1 hypothetical protein [Ideonella aquatica]